MCHFFENDTEISVQALLATKQKEDEIVKSFIELFREMSVWCPHGMSQKMLVEISRHNPQTKILIKKKAIESRSWKEQVKQGELAEDMICHIGAQCSTRSTPAKKQHPQSSQYKGKEA